MSFEKDITSIKSLAEAKPKPVFKAASQEEVSKRQVDYVSAFKEILDTLEFRLGWIKDDLQKGTMTEAFAKDTARRMRLYFESANREMKESGL